ncbi:hypothetical protein ACFL6C_05425 [Myxococcota bacterium]
MARTKPSESMSSAANTRRVSLALLVLWILAHSANSAIAATFYVRADGDNANEGTMNSAGGAWRTIDHAADNVRAGDVIRVQAGTYQERVTPGVSGSSVIDTVTFVADGLVTVCGFDFNNSNYVRVVGFTVDSDAGSCSMSNGCISISGTNTYLEIWNNIIQDCRYNGIRGGGFDRTNVLQNSLVIGNLFQDMGVGNGSGIAVNTPMDNTLIAYNEVYNSHPDAFYMFAANTRWLNNYIHGLSEASGGHSDIFQTGSNELGWENLLIEGTFQSGMGSLGDEHTSIVQHNQASTLCSGPCGDFQHVIWRRNVWHNVSSGSIGIDHATDGPIDNVYIYHNTTAEASENYDSNSYGSVINYSGTFRNFYILNNIDYEGWGSTATTNIEVYYVEANPFFVDYNLAYDPQGDVTFAAPWTSQLHPQSNADPDFNDYASDDFTLGSNSQAAGNAGPLTTTSGSGTGTAFDVAPHGGGFFRGDDTNLSQYGGNLVAGDLITVGADVVRVSSISGDTITVTEPFTWADNENVFLGNDSTPDIGAYPYRPGGYYLTVSYQKIGGTVSVVPSDVNLVRMVVVFEDGVPVGADSVSPYSVSGVGGGALDVRVYPLYASSTLFVAATVGGRDDGDVDGGGNADGAGDAHTSGTEGGGSPTASANLSGGCGCKATHNAQVWLLMLATAGLWTCVFVRRQRG